MSLETAMNVPRWRSVLNVLGVLFGLLLLVGLVMGLILFVASFFDKKGGERQPAAIFIDLGTARPAAANVRGRYPPPNSFDELPSHPGQGMVANFRGSFAARAPGGGNGSGARRAEAAASSQTVRAAVPVGISVTEYRAAIESGRKVYLPDPQGECALDGQDTAGLVGSLDKCFAPRAAR